MSLNGQTAQERAESIQTPEGSRHFNASEGVEDSSMDPSGSGFLPKSKRGSASATQSEAVDRGAFRIPKRPSVEGFSGGDSSSEADSGSSEDSSFRPSTTGKKSRGRSYDGGHSHKAREKLSDSSIFDPLALKQVDNLRQKMNFWRNILPIRFGTLNC